MPVETDYDPKYIALEDIPIAGPDEYSSTDKRLATFHAESRLELDLNNGKEIPQDEVTDSHQTAVMNLATHVLTHAAEEPSDVTLGDMSDGGGVVTEYSSRYLEAYESIVEQIRQSESEKYGNFSRSVNNGTSWL